jgi:hypothetical protein
MIIPKFKPNGTIVHKGHIYTAIKKLSRLLDKNNISYSFEKLHDGYIIRVPEGYEYVSEGDAVQHFASWGSGKNLIEVWGFGLTEPVGHLTPEEALEYFITWNNNRNKEA